jgi:hypothetical protein
MARRKQKEDQLPTPEEIRIGLHEAYWKLERRVEALEKLLLETKKPPR